MKKSKIAEEGNKERSVDEKRRKISIEDIQTRLRALEIRVETIENARNGTTS